MLFVAIADLRFDVDVREFVDLAEDVEAVDFLFKPLLEALLRVGMVLFEGNDFLPPAVRLRLRFGTAGLEENYWNKRDYIPHD